MPNGAMCECNDHKEIVQVDIKIYAIPNSYYSTLYWLTRAVDVGYMSHLSWYIVCFKFVCLFVCLIKFEMWCKISRVYIFTNYL